ncbi:hypothetical protein PYW08_002962 [Mythimna loreyi]|uniref:Uncharacterized protein n=1 Tax=Mythimna loreyi TaxID=667449 RepID=A0ACC2QQ19_9NEOP|nr:hypothetical protein PYW08_002962 [Mythimna loreyi]
MSLFPAYAQHSSENKTAIEVEEPCSESAALEAQLLASDNDDEHSGDEGAARDASAQPASEPSPCHQQDYYLDRSFDIGNLRVSTLYYPGRPQYNSVAPRPALGDAPRAAPPRARRYYAAPPPAPTTPQDDAERASRVAAFRDVLAQNPSDEATWLRFIDFQESCSADAALATANEAAARLRGSGRVRAALHRARELALPPAARLDLLRRDIAALSAGAGGTQGDTGEELTELWLRMVAGAAATGVAELEAAAEAALAATRALPLAYPHVLYAYGAALRAAGLWERLVLLLELVCSMNFPPAAFPPRDAPERVQQSERQLQNFEDKVSGSGLPVSTMWVRVERARAAAHWRAPAAAPAAPPDPQRAPAPADVAALLRPCAAPAAALLLVQALRLAKVPLLPCSGYALAPAAAANDALGDAHEADGAEALLPLLRAARRLPRAHPARPRAADAARALALLLDPPHYFTDDAGYLSWLCALWDAAAEWLAGERRVALLCWRLRWMHALVLLLDPQEALGKRETRRMRMEARAALKRFAGASPLPYIHFARIELAAADAPAARRAALHALRAAHADPAVPLHQRLYVARVAGEVCDAAVGLWGTVCGALEQALPPDEQLRAPPPPELQARALQACEAHCSRLEAAGDSRAAHVLDAQLPAPAEWAAARARLAGPRRRAELLRELRAAVAAAGAARYWEQAACALVLEAAREHRMAQCARALAPLFPHNGLLVLACSGAPLWAWERDGTHEERLRTMCGLRSHRAALAHALPPLLRAAAAAWAPRPAAAAAAAAARAARSGAGGALLHALRLECEARACGPRPQAALLAALDRYPQHKWLAVRGAAWVPALAASLADVLLERQLRAHTLLDEIVPARDSTDLPQ